MIYIQHGQIEKAQTECFFLHIILGLLTVNSIPSYFLPNNLFSIEFSCVFHFEKYWIWFVRLIKSEFYRASVRRYFVVFSTEQWKNRKDGMVIEMKLNVCYWQTSIAFNRDRKTEFESLLSAKNLSLLWLALLHWHSSWQQIKFNFIEN